MYFELGEPVDQANVVTIGRSEIQRELGRVSNFNYR